MSIVSWNSVGVRWLAWVGCILGSFLQSNFKFVPRKREWEREIVNMIFIWAPSYHNIIQTHSNVLWDWLDLVEHSSHSTWMWRIFCRILSIPQKHCYESEIMLWLWGKWLWLSLDVLTILYQSLAPYPKSSDLTLLQLESKLFCTAGSQTMYNMTLWFFSTL
jgi:hypothetical protein